MNPVISVEISPDSTESNAVAVLQTKETKGLCVIVMLSTYYIGSVAYSNLYVNVELAQGTIEQTIPFKKSILDCRHALSTLINHPLFRTNVLDKVIAKISELQNKGPCE